MEFEAGFLRPELAIQTHLDLARNNGAELQFNSPVESVRTCDDSILVQTKTREILADKVLLSAGGWIKDFFAGGGKAQV
ncbi:hypothetical protein [Algoriphagus boritolerans]|uniref:hypothetical protein n=1 Tax=Algoriphagus boritolerans TaxID=308111 RepID=UPI002FCDE88F